MAELFAALNIVVLERKADGRFLLCGEIPQWFYKFYPEIDHQRENIEISDNKPFLANFLIDAEIFWNSTQNGQIKSGPWAELDELDEDYYLEATALLVRERKMLLIEFPRIAYEEKQALIQKARDNKLLYYQSLKESQRKEILLHCIVHDLSNPLTVIKGCLSLLNTEELSADDKEMIDIARQQVIKQEWMLREILDAFAAEVTALEKFYFDLDNAPDLLNSVKEVLNTLKPTFIQNNIILDLQIIPINREQTQQWAVVGEKTRLERVLTNLLENGLRYSNNGGRLIVTCVEEEDSILTSIEDNGPGVATEMIGHLFQQFSQGKTSSGKVGLGLYFCRLMVEHWGGKIGYLPRAEGGANFWFRLLKPGAYQAAQVKNEAQAIS